MFKSNIWRELKVCLLRFRRLNWEIKMKYWWNTENLRIANDIVFFCNTSSIVTWTQPLATIFVISCLYVYIFSYVSVVNIVLRWFKTFPSRTDSAVLIQKLYIDLWISVSLNILSLCAHAKRQPIKSLAWDLVHFWTIRYTLLWFV